MLQHPHRDSPVAMGSVEHEVDELDSDPDTNLEQAATSLEAAAYAPPISQKGANHSAVESLPFFDNLRPGSYHEKKRSGQQKEAADGSIEMELTAGLTSIVAPSIESWWSCAAEMGLDLLAETEEDVAAARRKALADILRLVPTKEDSFLMVGKYFSDSPSWILQSTQQIIFVPGEWPCRPSIVSRDLSLTHSSPPQSTSASGKWSSKVVNSRSIVFGSRSTSWFSPSRTQEASEVIYRLRQGMPPPRLRYTMALLVVCCISAIGVARRGSGRSSPSCS